MTKRHRTILFFVLAATFLLLAPAIALYSQGYQLDWKNKRITQTGAFFVKAHPTRVNISVNGTPTKTTDFFFGTTRTKNYLPGGYLVRLEKAGYAPWEKHLDIREKFVTEVDVILFPKDPDFRALEDDIQDAWPSPDGRKVLLLETDLSNAPQLRLWDIREGRQTILWKAPSPQATVERVQWARDAERILFQYASQETLRSAIIHTPSHSSSSCKEEACPLSFIPLLQTEQIRFSPNENKIIVLRSLRDRQILQEVDYVEERLGSFWGNNVITFTVSGDQVYWLEDTGFAQRTGVPAPDPQPLHSEAFSVERETAYALSFVNGSVLLQKGNQLYLLQDNSFREIGGFVQESQESPNGGKLALSNNAELWFYALSDQDRQPARKAGDTVFLTRLSDSISSPVWITSSYIAFAAGDRILIAETDNRDRINIVELASFPNPQFFWQPDEKALYVFSENTLYASQKLI